MTLPRRSGAPLRPLRAHLRRRRCSLRLHRVPFPSTSVAPCPHHPASLPPRTQIRLVQRQRPRRASLRAFCGGSVGALPRGIISVLPQCFHDGSRYAFVLNSLKYPAESVVVCGESIGSVATVHIAQAKDVRRCRVASHCAACTTPTCQTPQSQRFQTTSLWQFQTTLFSPFIRLLLLQRHPPRPCLIWPARYFPEASRYRFAPHSATFPFTSRAGFVGAVARILPGGDYIVLERFVQQSLRLFSKLNLPSVSNANYLNVLRRCHCSE